MRCPQVSCRRARRLVYSIPYIPCLWWAVQACHSARPCASSQRATASYDLRASLCSTPPPSYRNGPFQTSKVQPPPRRGSVGLSERPKVQAPPPGGSVGHSESPRSNPPRGPQETLKKWSERARKGCFLRDLQVIFMRFPCGWRSVGLLKRSKVQLPPTGGSVGPRKRSITRS